MKEACATKKTGTRLVDNCDLPQDLELTERVEVDDETLPYAKEDWTAQNKLKLIKEYSLTFPSPWKHAKAKEEKARRSTTRMAKILS